MFHRHVATVHAPENCRHCIMNRIQFSNIASNNPLQVNPQLSVMPRSDYIQAPLWHGLVDKFPASVRSGTPNKPNHRTAMWPCVTQTKGEHVSIACIFSPSLKTSTMCSLTLCDHFKALFPNDMQGHKGCLVLVQLAISSDAITPNLIWFCGRQKYCAVWSWH